MADQISQFIQETSENQPPPFVFILGLSTKPIAVSTSDKNGPASLLPNEEDYRGKSTKTASKHDTRSQRAQAVLDSFPLLDFMQSPVLSGSLQATSAKL